MSNLILVEGKRKRFNPYKVVEYTGYALAAAFVVWCMWWTALNINDEPVPPDMPWWWLPVGMIGMAAFLAVGMGAIIGLFYAGHGVYNGFLWLRERGREYGKIED